MSTDKLKFRKAIIPHMQNEINKSIVLNFLMENKSLSRARVAASLNISAPTASKIIDELIKEGFVIETGKSASTGGKRPTNLEFNPDYGAVIGVDLAKDSIRMARCDFCGSILEKHIGFKIYNKDEDLLDKVIKELEQFIENINSDSSNGKKHLPLKAICMGVPAAVDLDSGEIKSAALFEGWEGLKLREILSEHFDLPIYIENSTNISAMGDKYFGEAKQYSEIAFLEVSEGIGAGIIINNKIYRGAYNSSGEVGYILGRLEELYSSYKNKGYMEYEASLENMEKEAIKAIKDGKKTLLREIISGDITKINAAIVCKAASLGDLLAREIIKKIVENLALIIINLILILNPEIVIIGGNICALPEAQELFITPIKEIADRIVPFDLPEIKLSVVGKDGGVMGASFYAIDNILTKYFPYKI
jgi:glucokinase